MSLALGEGMRSEIETWVQSGDGAEGPTGKFCPAGCPGLHLGRLGGVEEAVLRGHNHAG